MPKKTIIKSILMGDSVITEDSDQARELFNKSRFGVVIEGNKIQLALIEALYLLEKKTIIITNKQNKEIEKEKLLKKASKLDPNFLVRYQVFKDMRDRGYIIKTALKFGADFRVYDRGVKPGEDHAKWVVFPVKESNALTWHEFSAKTRVAHSTKKRLLIGVVDDENDVTYWEIRWIRP